ncbi:MAG TPA: ankyrin repeat domain-containing protein [Gammaproteobacteria bacterium]|nr:ankyrin repeat domain-containing protein [Gammaproteobacteria bacterium]HVY53695.1 ankyrin repeat domain-containing protein [Gammaproteobacteria bacterium]
MKQLIEAVQMDDATKTAELLRSGLDANGYEDYARVTPLHFAAQANALESAQLLLQAGANPASKTIEGITPLNIALLYAHLDMMSLLSSDYGK